MHQMLSSLIGGAVCYVSLGAEFVPKELPSEEVHLITKSRSVRMAHDGPPWRRWDGCQLPSSQERPALPMSLPLFDLRRSTCHSSHRPEGVRRRAQEVPPPPRIHHLLPRRADIQRVLRVCSFGDLQGERLDVEQADG